MKNVTNVIQHKVKDVEDIRDMKDKNKEHFVEPSKDVVEHLAVITMSSHLQSEPSISSLALEIIEQHT